MTWDTQKKRIRRYLRDPSGNIWSDALLQNLFNDIQRELQQQTNILEEVMAIRVPPLYQTAYMFDHEWNQLPAAQSQFHQCLKYHHQSNIVICYEWEGQVLNRIDDGAPDEGSRFTQPWEAFMNLTPGAEVRFRFPKNFQALKFIAYDREPIEFTTRKDVAKRDTSHITRSGSTVAYYRPDDLDNSFVAYPRPSLAWTDDLVGGESGMVLFNTDDTTLSEVGTIILRDGTTLQTQTGVALDLIRADDNFFIVYDVLPRDVIDGTDSVEYPQYLEKYIEYGVLERAYKANNDGAIPSLAEYWGFRYSMGIRFIRQFKTKRRQDRDYRLGTQRLIRTRKAHPRLPDGYPPCP